MDGRIILYGVGLAGEKFYWRTAGQVEICYCLDRKAGRDFHGLPVYTWQEKRGETAGNLIVIAAEDAAYGQISQMLQRDGLKEGADFIRDRFLEKRPAVLYGNCHMNALGDYLDKNPYFIKEYYVIRWMVMRRDPPPDFILRSCRLLICQDIRKGNSEGALSAEEMEEKTGDDCMKYRIPNLFGFYSLFPQRIRPSDSGSYISHISEEAIREDRDRNDRRILQNIVGNIAAPDENIDRMYYNGVRIRDMAESIRHEDLYTDIADRFARDLEKTQSREAQCDIAISDYIKANCTDTLLFYDAGHPTGCIIAEYGRRLLSCLRLPVYEKFPMQVYLDNGEVFVYGCVKRQLKMNFRQEFIRCYSREYTLWNEPLDLEGYIRQYLIWNFGVQTDEL